jgi:ABC-2 type transport system ATP-binding protein
MTDLMIEATGLSKNYGTVRALDDVSIVVPRGSVLGLLGHNGAGKTTLVDILATVLPPSGGSALVAGHDVVREPDAVRGRIGLTGQFAALDDQLSGVDNLVLVARLLGESRRAAKVRAGELLELFDLAEAGRRVVRTYSGGMRRRLDLAASLIGQPDVIFLDEPTTGLDPSSRIGLWKIVEDLVARGTTVLLTTQYLEEADRLADSIVVLSKGTVVASGTPAELKSQLGQRTVTVTLEEPLDADRATKALREVGLHPAHDSERNAVTTPISESRAVALVVRALDEAGVGLAELSMTEPTLDDVYLTLAQDLTGVPR